MSDTWDCSQCGQPVPDKCDGKCGKGTWSGRLRQAAAIATVTAVIAAGLAGCQLATSEPGFGSDSSGTSTDVPFTADCDAHGQAVDVQPDTAAARQAADRMCAATESEVNNAPWPSGWHPIPGGAVANR